MPIPLDTATELRFIKLLSSLTEYKASDLHLTVATPPSLRIGGKIVPLLNEDLISQTFIQQIVGAMISDEQADQLQLKRSLVFAFTLKGKMRYKVHIYYQHQQLAASFRYLPTVVQSISHLPVPAAVQALSQLPHGLVIIAGDYGTGKSTVLAGLIEAINLTSAQHIVTFEQPIELIFTDNKAIIEQVELGRDLPDLTYAIDFVSNEDVDTIMVAAPLEAANIRTVLQLVAMGKLVLMEVPAPNIQRALERLVTIFSSDEQAGIREALATGLQAAVALRLFTTASGTNALAAEVLRSATGLANFLRHESFDQLETILANSRTEGMLTFAQAEQELQALV